MSLDLLDIQNELSSLRECLTQSKAAERVELAALNATLVGIEKQLARVADVLERVSSQGDSASADSVQGAPKFSWSQR